MNRYCIFIILIAWRLNQLVYSFNYFSILYYNDTNLTSHPASCGCFKIYCNKIFVHHG